MLFVFHVETADDLFKVEVKGAKSLYSAIKKMRKQHPFETHRIINVEQRGLDRLTS